MFEIPVYVSNGKEEMPNDDILYIVCKEGTYLKKKLGIMESITPVKNISVLESVEMMATMHIKSIPGTLFSQVMAFFRGVYKEYSSEAIVLLFYNEEKKVYRLVVPAQKVSGGGVDYNRAVTVDGYIMVGDIHSHSNFSAFHSTTDDKDEESFDGLHITIGNNGDAEVSISASIVSNGQRFIVQAEDYINGITLTTNIDETVERPFSTVYMYDHVTKKMVPKESQKTYTVRRFDKRYVSNVSSKYQRCSSEWFKLVEKQAWTSYTTGVMGGYVQPWMGNHTWRRWNIDHYDPDAWKNHSRNKTTPTGQPPLIPAKTTPIKFPPHVQATGPHEEILDENGFNPCEACPFKSHKIDWALEQITEAELNSDDGDKLSIFHDENGNLIDWYECNQCDAVFYTSEEMAVCPNCQVDDHLILMDVDDIQGDERITKDNYPACITPESYNYKCKDCGTETSVLNHGDCPFCGGDVKDVINQQALDTATEEDETLERLPIPDQDSIPLTSRKQKRKDGVFNRLFRNKDKK